VVQCSQLTNSAGASPTRTNTRLRQRRLSHRTTPNNYLYRANNTTQTSACIICAPDTTIRTGRSSAAIQKMVTASIQPHYTSIFMRRRPLRNRSAAASNVRNRKPWTVLARQTALLHSESDGAYRSVLHYYWRSRTKRVLNGTEHQSPTSRSGVYHRIGQYRNFIIA